MKAKTICFLFSFLFALTINGQNGFDLSALDIKYHGIVNSGDRVLVGFEGEFGINITNFILAAGDHFASDGTLIKYNGRDEYDDESYTSLLGMGIFIRIRNDKKLPIDIGWRGEVFLHSDESSNNLGGGVFNGIFVGIFTPTEFMTKGEKKKRKSSIGLRLTPGIFNESGRKEFGVLGDVWVRLYLYKKYKK